MYHSLPSTKPQPTKSLHHQSTTGSALVGRPLILRKFLNEPGRLSRLNTVNSKSVADHPGNRQVVSTRVATESDYFPSSVASSDTEYDAIIIGSGMGGLSTAAQMVAKGAKVLVLEKYTIPGGSAGHFKRDGYTFDVGSSMMFGFGDKGSTNLITKCLASVGKKMESVPDPTQVHYHLPKSERFPKGLNIQVWRKYEEYMVELTRNFPNEAKGIKTFYDECWKVFNPLNSIELKSLEEPRYLMAQFIHNPIGCLWLAYFLTQNTGDVARKFIKDPELLRFIDLECFTYSTVKADLTPMVTSGMVLSDRHYGGVRYPVGGIGKIAETVAEGILDHGGHIVYKANVTEITMTGSGSNAKATGVKLADGRVFKSKAVISNATRWDTFERMIGDDKLPEGEKLFRQRYKKAPSFFSMHLGIKADVLPKDTDCHHIILEDWDKMEEARGTLFVSMPSLLDSSLAPDGCHIVHAFTPDWIDSWTGLSQEEYVQKKNEMADSLIKRLEAVFPGLSAGVVFREIGTPKTHRRFLNRPDGTYGPIPVRAPWGIVTMPFNTTDIKGLYCVGDSTFPGQGVNAVVFSGFGCAHRALCDLGLEETWPELVDEGWKGAIRLTREAALRAGGPDLQPAEVAAVAANTAAAALGGMLGNVVPFKSKSGTKLADSEGKEKMSSSGRK